MQMLKGERLVRAMEREVIDRKCLAEILLLILEGA